MWAGRGRSGRAVKTCIREHQRLLCNYRCPRMEGRKQNSKGLEKAEFSALYVVNATLPCAQAIAPKALKFP